MMPNLRSLNDILSAVNVSVPCDIQVAKRALLTNDSRLLKSDDVFCAVIGQQADGRDYIEQALQKNVALVIKECQNEDHHGQVTQLTGANGEAVYQVNVFQLNLRLFDLASSFYDFPQQQLCVCGVTGTNGKTSISQLIAQLFALIGKPCAIIGTNGAGLPGQLLALNNTTPGATELMNLLASFAEQEIKHVAMEVSSHALDQKRVAPELFDVAVFSNLSRDHLDYHQTMDAYAKAKFTLFTQQSGQIAVINGTDEIAKQWLKYWPRQDDLIVYCKGEQLNNFKRFVQASDIKHSASGASFILTTELDSVAIESPLLGDFNIDNLMAAVAVLLSQGFSLKEIALQVPKLTAVDGRMETFKGENSPTVVVDYAHTPDALEKVLHACRAHCHGNLWLVFGCGGDRDKGKRAMMAAVAERFADKVMVTSDNPRNEEPIDIIQDIVEGFEDATDIMIEVDRAKAIKEVIAGANKADIIVLAGKGHEDYIEVAGQKHHFDERVIVKQALAQEVSL
ncbi:UDP-N-acetylmuramoyl-L-alanyl-D-glutamate--2,6-diaminopimelate ligase [Thalassotalea ganghwensis]